MDTLKAIGQALIEPLLFVADPEQRIFWPFILSSLLLALWVGLRERKLFSLRFLRDYLFPKEILFHSSALLDYRLLFVKAVIRTLLIAPWALSAFGLSVWWVGVLNKTFGLVEHASIDRGWVMLLYTLTLFVAWDLSRYLLHRLLHGVPFLWELHKVHHSAEVLTPLTLYRSHPIESFLYRMRGVLVVSAVTGTFFYFFQNQALQYQMLGVNVLGFFFNMAGGNLRHSHIWLSYGRHLERWLISPAQHQIHHSLDSQHFNKNYGTWLAIWDRMAGSLYTTTDKETLVYGLSQEELNHHPHRVVSVLLGPIFASLRRLWPSGHLGHKFVGLQRKSRLVHGIIGFCFCLLLAGTAFAQGDETESKSEEEALAEKSVVDKVEPFVIEEPLPEKGGEVAAQENPDFDLSLDTISIIGTREKLRKAVGSGHVVKEEELERFDYDDVHQVLKQTPGVYVRGEDGYGLRPNIGLRGANSDRSAKVTLMEDGILLGPAPYAAPAAYYFPLMARISGVEVYKGPAAIRYGPNTIGGALNMQTRQIPRSPTLALDLGYGMENFGRIHGHMGTSTKHWGVLLEGVHLSSDGFKELDGGGRTGFNRNEFLLKTRYNTDPGKAFYQQLDARVGYANELSKETYLGITDADFAATPYRRYLASRLGRMDWDRMQMRLGYYLAKDENFDLQLVGYRHDFARDWRKLNSFRGGDLRDILSNPDSGQSAVFNAILKGEEDTVSDEQVLLIGTNGRVFVSQGINLVAHFKPTFGKIENEIEFGLRLHQDEIRRTHTEDGYLMTQGELVAEGGERDTTASNIGAAETLALHLYDEISWGNIMLAPGCRFEWIETNFDNLLSETKQKNTTQIFLPGLGLHYELLPWLGVLAGVHRGFSPVSPGQADDVLPEQSVNYELGTRLVLDNTEAEFIGFFNDYSNLTGECTFSSGCQTEQLNQQFNGGRVHVYGFELLLAHEVRSVWGIEFGTKALYTLTLSEFQSSFSSANPQFGEVQLGDKLPYVPEHQGTWIGRMAKGKFEVNFSLSYVGEMRDMAGQGDIPENEQIAARWQADLTGNFEILEDIYLYLTLNNVLNKRYMVARRPFGARPGRPFQALAGIKYLLKEKKE